MHSLVSPLLASSGYLEFCYRYRLHRARLVKYYYRGGTTDLSTLLAISGPTLHKRPCICGKSALDKGREKMACLLMWWGQLKSKLYQREKFFTRLNKWKHRESIDQTLRCVTELSGDTSQGFSSGTRAWIIWSRTHFSLARYWWFEASW